MSPWGHTWGHMCHHGVTCHHGVIHGATCVIMGPYVPLWGHTWGYMCHHGVTHVTMGSYMGLHVSLWGHTWGHTCHHGVIHGATCVIMGSHMSPWGHTWGYTRHHGITRVVMGSYVSPGVTCVTMKSYTRSHTGSHMFPRGHIRGYTGTNPTRSYIHHRVIHGITCAITALHGDKPQGHENTR